MSRGSLCCGLGLTNNVTFAGRSCSQARSSSSWQDITPRTSWDQFSTSFGLLGSAHVPINLFFHSWTTPGKRVITETALEGVAVTYPLPLSRPFGLGWTTSLIPLMGCLAGFLRVALSTKGSTAVMESRSERHSLSKIELQSSSCEPKRGDFGGN